MNEITDKLIRDLADKLGTTSVHLWSVLVRQATIVAVTKLCVVGLCSAALVWALKVVSRKTTKPAKTEANQYPDAEWDDEFSIGAWTAWSIATLAVVLITALNAEDIVGALLNPEYWALTQLIHH